LGAKERDLLERERALLGFDPYRYELGPVQVRTIEKLMDYLQADQLLQRRFTMGDLFPYTKLSSQSSEGAP
jgi:hypothetical protein